MQVGLCIEILNLIEAYGLEGERTLQALAEAAGRVICVDAPDRQTAEDWHLHFCGSIHIAVNNAAENGDAVWSRVRLH